jgi:6-pyruvoyltetrahydropterin/6-carboxytetrahydropterin synthase
VIYTISKQFDFSASRVLDVHAGHPCARLHGHNWVVTVFLAADALDGHGFVLDFLDLTP